MQGDAIDHVAERLDRLKEIDAELKTTQVHRYLAHDASEQPEACLTVADEEVKVLKVLNAEERKAAAAAGAAAAKDAAAISSEQVGDPSASRGFFEPVKSSTPHDHEPYFFYTQGSP